MLKRPLKPISVVVGARVFDLAAIIMVVSLAFIIPFPLLFLFPLPFPFIFPFVII